MKKFYSLLIVSLFAVQFAQTSAQETKVTIEDFITEHDGFEVNADGEIKPINNREINKKIRFFIEEKYLNVQFTRNIIWDSYETFLSPYDIYHSHRFIVQVKVNGIDRLKYLEIAYNPKTLKVSSNFEWNEEEAEFVKNEVDKEVEAINS
ncbi:MAG: hypothetical protein P8N57_01515 [Flavobacteriaceae bacterium]|nr:hypothetical protein [Flavobacteriaceae bacterium]